MIDSRLDRAVDCASPAQIVKLLADVNAVDPVEVETRARALRLMAEHGATEIKFECRVKADGAVEWYLWFYFNGMSCLRSGKTLAEATAKLLPDIPAARRRGDIFARTEKLMAEQEAADKADRLTANATNPQVPEEPEPFCEATGPMPADPDDLCAHCGGHRLSHGPCGCPFIQVYPHAETEGERE